MGRVAHPAAILAGLLDAHPALRGSVRTSPSVDQPSPLPGRTDQLQAAVIWMDGEPLLPGRRYRLTIGAETVLATVAPLRYRVDLESGQRMAATKLERDEVGVCDLELSSAVSFTAYGDDPERGTFLLVHPLSDEPLGAGAIRYGLRRAGNLPEQRLTVDRQARARRAGQTPCVLWFTGRPGAGKSTIANRVEAELHARGGHTYLLDGDNVRRGLNRDLGFTDADRVENIRRAAEVARLMLDAGLIVLVSFISPFRSERDMARSLVGEREFLEIFIDTPLAVAEARDPKGLYAKARRGELRHFTGIDSPYEAPTRPELRIATTEVSAQDGAARVIELLEARDLLPGR